MKKLPACLFLAGSIIILFLTSGVQASTPAKPVKYTQAKIGSKIYKLEIADTLTRQVKGLSNRPHLEPNRGMIFVFKRPDFHYFCMSEMKFPLDFIWLHEDMVMELSENIPAPQVGLPAATNLHATDKTDKVIELNAGQIKLSQLKVGDIIIFH